MTVLAEIATASSTCQRWAGRTSTWRRAGEPFDPGRYVVAPVAHGPAKAFVVDQHYSGTFPSAKHVYGLHEAASGRLVGVAVLSIPTSMPVLTNVFPGLEPMVESLELGRFVLVDDVPANGESWFLARAFRLAADVGVRGVVSFADPVPRSTAAGLVFPGHVGMIYQASNALLAGRSTARTVRLLPDGTTLNDRAVSKVRAQDRGHEYVERRLVAMGARPLRAGEDPAAWLASALDDVGARPLRHRGCHRYVFTLGNRAERRAVELGVRRSGAYPKAADPLPPSQLTFG